MARLVAFVVACGGSEELLDGWYAQTDTRLEGTTRGTYDTYFIPAPPLVDPHGNRVTALCRLRDNPALPPDTRRIIFLIHLNEASSAAIVAGDAGGYRWRPLLRRLAQRPPQPSRR